MASLISVKTQLLLADVLNLDHPCRRPLAARPELVLTHSFRDEGSPRDVRPQRWKRPKVHSPPSFAHAHHSLLISLSPGLRRCSSPCTSATMSSTSARFPSCRRRCAGTWWSSARSPARPTATWLRCGGAQVSASNKPCARTSMSLCINHFTLLAV